MEYLIGILLLVIIIFSFYFIWTIPAVSIVVKIFLSCLLTLVVILSASC